jgi:fructokinase
VQQFHRVDIHGSIEAGGTKFICGVGTGPDDLRTIQIPTTTPHETIAAAIEFLKGHAPVSIGIGSFGPVKDGRITNTPKAGWQNVDLKGEIATALGVPVGFDTDVNAAALAETHWGAARDVASCLYLTIGTGIGGGAIFNGVPLHGLMHPEMGHIRIPASDGFPGGFSGVCPFHGNCLEGLASGPAIAKIWGRPAEELPPGYPAWDLEARYLALAVANFAFTLGPARIILGGGVMRQRHLFPLIRREFATLINNYLPVPDNYIVPPELGDRAGVLGGLLLARAASRIPHVR